MRELLRGGQPAGRGWWLWVDSNHRPQHYEAEAAETVLVKSISYAHRPRANMTGDDGRRQEMTGVRHDLVTLVSVVHIQHRKIGGRSGSYRNDSSRCCFWSLRTREPLPLSNAARRPHLRLGAWERPIYGRCRLHSWHELSAARWGCVAYLMLSVASILLMVTTCVLPACCDTSV